MQGDADRDELVMILVESALALPVSEREPWLREACERDSALLAEVLDRVEWEERMSDFLREPVVSKKQTHEQIFAPSSLVMGRYRIVRQVNAGRTALVYEALDTTLDRRIALKCSRPGCTLPRPPEAAFEIGHPGLCKLHQWHTLDSLDGPVDFFTMEFVEGKHPEPLPDRQARGVAVEICAALGYAHARGLAHSDLDSRNILLRRSGDGAPKPVLISCWTGATAANDIPALAPVFRALIAGRLSRKWKRVIDRCAAGQYGSAGEILRDLTPWPAVLKWSAGAAALAVAGVVAALLWPVPDTFGPTVRLAILPVPAALGITAELTDEFAGLRPNFTVISPVEAMQHRVSATDQAKPVLGATHVLGIRLTGDAAAATISDAETGQSVREWRGASRDPAALTDSLREFIGATFRVRGRARAVANRAFEDYAEGLALIRFDPSRAGQAIPLFRKALANDPRSSAIRAGLAEADLIGAEMPGSGRGGAGCRDLIDGGGPESLAALLVSGECEERQGRLPQAIGDYMRATQLAPASSEAWIRLASAYAAAKEPDKAVSAWRKAIEAQPDYYPCYLGFGQYYLSRGDLIEAEAMFRHLTWIAPALAIGHAELSRVLKLQGRDSEAEAEAAAAK